MDKSADFGSADPGSSPGGATSSERVEINTGPKTVKTQPELYLTLMCAMEDASKYLRRYLETGDINDARRATDAWMIIGALLRHYQLDQMWGAVIGGDHPISEEERQKAKESYSQSG